MKIEEIILKSDFSRLTKKERNKFLKILDIKLPEGIDSRDYLFENKNIVLDNEETKKMLLNKIFAG